MFLVRFRFGLDPIPKTVHVSSYFHTAWKAGIQSFSREIGVLALDSRLRGNERLEPRTAAAAGERHQLSCITGIAACFANPPLFFNLLKVQILLERLRYTIVDAIPDRT
jgi:hypothetical protein